jgi:hypothetical protein
VAKVPGFEEWAAFIRESERERGRARISGAPHNVGLDMITQGRAETAARRLFADEYSNGDDCRAEEGREGEPCRHCAKRWRNWCKRVTEVRAAMIEAFS